MDADTVVDGMIEVLNWDGIGEFVPRPVGGACENHHG